jgi:hypothetical protein
MALVHLNQTVGTTNGLLFQVPTGIKAIASQIQNNDAAAIFIGDSTSTTSGALRGHSIAAGATFQLWLNGGDKVYAISAAGTTAGAVVITYSGI